ncbi:MAG: dodecin domain-containing protein [Gammaproteobacteria bacterium]|nr:dodecin domain-containing protein [Gammaproteobacteria bacterium]
MSDHIYKSIELTGTSKTSVEEAVKNAIATATKTIHSLRWFEVTDIRGVIENNVVAHWQITMKVSFTLDEKTEQMPELGM